MLRSVPECANRPSLGCGVVDVESRERVQQAVTLRQRPRVEAARIRCLDALERRVDRVLPMRGTDITGNANSGQELARCFIAVLRISEVEHWRRTQ